MPLDDITTSTDTPVVVDEVPVVVEEVPVVVEEVPVVVEEVPIVVEEVPYITTIGELVSFRGAIVQKEQQDKAAILSVFSPSTNILREKLFAWAANGFPPMSTLLTTQIIPPSVCSDNVQRELVPYIEFLLDSKTLESAILTLEERVDGINFSYNITQLNVVCLTVIKT